MWGVADRLGTALRHRGPDDSGWLAGWVREGHTLALHSLDRARSQASPPDLVLAHRRLSIVDLATGWQPIGNETRDVWIVYNGEIYNHLELRAELEGLGHRFDSRSDTEMVVHAYEAWGPKGFSRFNGIFAFAIWDARRRQLIVARDPLGVKPLYCGVGSKALWFASEVKAVIQAGLYDPALNRSALDLYLSYRFVPSPQTLFRGVSRVPPGHWTVATAEGGWSAPVRYAPEPAAEDRETSLAGWVERLAAATRTAVTGQLMADVPVGALLSGGLDSSLVVTVMQEQQSAPVETYAVGFDDPSQESELQPARRAARVLGTRHHEVHAVSADLFREWVATISQIDEPVVTPSHAPLAALCRRVRADLKVVLTGQGADEPLAGYLRHSVERWVRFLGARPVAATLRAAARRMPTNELARRLAAVASEGDLARRLAEAFAVFGGPRRRLLLDAETRRDSPEDGVVEPVRMWLRGTEGLDSLNQLLYVDARLSLADDLLLGTDKVAMASSVEARVPYLDLGYLALAETIPGHLKLSWWHGRKRLQHLVGRRMLPSALGRDLTYAWSGWRKKRGFDVPVRQWFGPSHIQAAGRFIAGPSAALPAYLNREEMVRLIEEHAIGRADHTRRLVALLTLEAWHRTYLGGDATVAGGLLDVGGDRG